MVPSSLLPLVNYPHAQKLKIVFTDIDGTLTVDGQLPAASYEALWHLQQQNIQVVPVTGRPAGWCEMMARLWPVAGVVGENGGFYFAYQNKIMHREFETPEAQRKMNSSRLDQVFLQIKKHYPRAEMASDQFSRLCDLAVDFCEDIHPPLSLEDARGIQNIFEQAGATAKISSIHVNGWFGDYDKRKMCQRFAREILNFDLEQMQDQTLFVGDSPNDEPLFRFFTHSFAVANIGPFIAQLKSRPRYLATQPEGHGFVEIVNGILSSRSEVTLL